MASPHTVSREGIVAGVIGATVVAVWFLIVDTIAGHPLQTPTLLGGALLRIFGPSGENETFSRVAAYTIFHYGVFALAGLLFAFVVHHAETEPSMLAVFLILFIIFELGFFGLTATLAETRSFGGRAWYQISLANLLAAVAMGFYLWRRHPALRAEIGQALRGEI